MKTKLTLFFALFVSVAFGQEVYKSCYVQGDSCYSVTYKAIDQVIVNCEGRHLVFDDPGSEPLQLARLGTNPQFGTLKFFNTTAEVLDHLRKVYAENQNGNALELDNLWRAMGYSGFNDARFKLDYITPVNYDPGVTGMLGAGGNTYVYASIGADGSEKFKGYRMDALNGCDVTIMEICGNAFYPQGTPDTQTLSNNVISKKACKLNLPFGFTKENSTIQAFSENGNCYVRVCRKPESQDGTSPVKVTDLGHNQQFGSMVDAKTPQEVYATIMRLYQADSNGDAEELDRLLQSIGYDNGVMDSRFQPEIIDIINYEGGVAAVMGGGEHQYMFSEISTENYDNLRGFKIPSLNENCDLTIIDVCGNALYCPQPLNCQTIECNCN